MRTTTIIVCLFLCLTSCRDAKKDSEQETDSETSIELNDNQDSTQNDGSSNQNSEYSANKTDSDTTKSEDKTENTSTDISGIYRNSEHLDDTSCNCYCIDVKTNGTSELCLSEDELYIKGRFESSGNKINIYYAGKGAQNNNEEIPWDEFETGTPIAVLTPADNGVKLDWKGFSIDGKIAVDYALYGKKTLEGTYKKK